MRKILLFVLLLGLVAAGLFTFGVFKFADQPSPGPPQANRSAPPARAAASSQAVFPSDDQAVLRAAEAPEPRPIMQAQVVLERLGFSSGVIDGKEGRSLAGRCAGSSRPIASSRPAVSTRPRAPRLSNGSGSRRLGRS